MAENDLYITHNGDTSRRIKYTPSLLAARGRESHDFLVRFQLFVYTQLGHRSMTIHYTHRIKRREKR